MNRDVFVIGANELAMEHARLLRKLDEARELFRQYGGDGYAAQYGAAKADLIRFEEQRARAERSSPPVGGQAPLAGAPSKYAPASHLEAQ